MQRFLVEEVKNKLQFPDLEEGAEEIRIRDKHPLTRPIAAGKTLPLPRLGLLTPLDEPRRAHPALS